PPGTLGAGSCSSAARRPHAGAGPGSGRAARRASPRSPWGDERSRRSRSPRAPHPPPPAVGARPGTRPAPPLPPPTRFPSPPPPPADSRLGREQHHPERIAGVDRPRELERDATHGTPALPDREARGAVVFQVRDTPGVLLPEAEEPGGSAADDVEDMREVGAGDQRAGGREDAEQLPE